MLSTQRNLQRACAIAAMTLNGALVLGAANLAAALAEPSEIRSVSARGTDRWSFMSPGARASLLLIVRPAPDHPAAVGTMSSGSADRVVSLPVTAFRSSFGSLALSHVLEGPDASGELQPPAAAPAAALVRFDPLSSVFAADGLSMGERTTSADGPSVPPVGVISDALSGERHKEPGQSNSPGRIKDRSDKRGRAEKADKTDKADKSDSAGDGKSAVERRTVARLVGRVERSETVEPVSEPRRPRAPVSPDRAAKLNDGGVPDWSPFNRTEGGR